MRYLKYPDIYPIKIYIGYLHRIEVYTLGKVKGGLTPSLKKNTSEKRTTVSNIVRRELKNLELIIRR